MKTALLTGIQVPRAAELLKEGHVVSIPTETVYGLAGNALNENAVIKIFTAKGRPKFDPLIVHIPDAHIDRYARLDLLSPLQKSAVAKLSRKFWPGPLTLVLPKTDLVPDLVTSGLPNVALRVPRHPLALELLRLCAFPLAAPSANPFGRVSPTTAQAVESELAGKISAILDGGPCQVGLESTVIGILPDQPFFLFRPGGIPQSEIESEIEAPLQSVQSVQKAQLSPGLLASHYAPRKPLKILPSAFSSMNREQLNELWPLDRKISLILMQGQTAKAQAQAREITGAEVTTFSLSETGQIREAARSFFSTLRIADATPCQEIWCEPCPWEQDIGPAIADRLARASAVKSQALEL